MFCPGVGQGHAVDEHGQLLTLVPALRMLHGYLSRVAPLFAESAPPLFEGPGHDDDPRPRRVQA